MPASLAGRRVLLGVTGGIAAYKSIQLARELTRRGATVDTVLTRGAREFVRPISFEGVTGRRPHEELLEPGGALLHIRLARMADLVLVAPATADFCARAAMGRSDDLLSAVLLATTAPVVLAPAMNDRMWAHPAVAANVETLLSRGIHIAGPATGPLAWNEGEGPGRMLEPEELVEEAARALTRADLAGRSVVVTAGGTREAIDPVRFIGNHSSGRMGLELAREAWRRGANVTLILGTHSIAAMTHGFELVNAETTAEMASAVRAHRPHADLFIMCAAVADFHSTTVPTKKIRKEAGAPAPIALSLNEDILASTAPLAKAGSISIGFALETGDALSHAADKRARKQVDLLVVNDATEPGAGFGVDTNRVTIVGPAGHDDLPLMSKGAVAAAILDRARAVAQ